MDSQRGRWEPEHDRKLVIYFMTIPNVVARSVTDGFQRWSVGTRKPEKSENDRILDLLS
jgi:hypothetical protein